MFKIRKFTVALFLVLVAVSVAWAATPKYLPYGLKMKELSSAPSTPSTDYGIFYISDSGGTTVPYFIDSAGTSTSMIEGASSVSLDAAYTVGNTITGDASGNVEIDLSVTARKVEIANTFAGTQAVALEIDSETAARAITDGILFSNSGAAATITNAINASDADITNAINVGANTITGTNAVIDFAEFDVSGTTGAVTINDGGDAGSVTVEGTVLDINSLDFVGAGGITAAASSAITLNPNSGNAAGEDLIVTAHNVQLTAAGKLTMSPDAAETLALDISDTDYTNALSVGDNAIIGTTGLIDYTNFDVDASGNVSCNDLTASGTVSLGTVKMDAIEPLSGAPQTITIDGAGAGGVTIGATSTGDITLGDTVTVSDGYNVTVGEGQLTVDDDQNENALIVDADHTTTGSAVLVTSDATTAKSVSITADSLTGGDVLYLDATEGAGFTGNYMRCYDGAADDFKVARHGATTITGVASTDVLTVSAGDIQITTGDIDLDDGIIAVDNDADEANNITRNFNGVGTGPVLTVKDDHTATTNVALLVESDGTGASTALQISHDGDNPAIDIDAGVARTGDVINIDMANQLAEKAIDIGTGDAWTGTAGEGLIDAQTSGQIVATASMLRLDMDTAQAADGSDGYAINVDDDTLVAATPSVYAVLIDSNANEALHVATGKALFDENATFTVGATITGSASSDVLTVTAGDIQITEGDIDLDDGIIAVDNDADEANNITRNYNGVGTGPVLTVKDDHTATTNVALLVESDGTGASTALQISHDGDNPAIDIDAGVARTGDVINIDMANQLAEKAIDIGTGDAWTGTAGEGLIDAQTSGQIAATASMLRLDMDTAQAADGSDGYAINVDDDTLVAATPSVYAVLIDSNANEALHVATGKALFDEQATFTLGVDADADVDIDLATNTAEVSIVSAAADYAAGSGVVTIYDDSAGQANASYSLRIAHEADGDAQNHFILCEDNSTGAAANGDDKFKVDSEGTITMGAGSTGTGGALIYSFENLTIDNAGTAASVVQVVTFITTDGDANEDNATLANGTVGQIKIFVTAAEGAGGDTYKITPASLNGGTQITFDGAVGDGCTMIYDGSAWNIISNNGGVIS